MDTQNSPSFLSERTYQVRPYQADGGFDLAGISLLMSVLTLAAVVVGLACYAVSLVFWVILLFPLLAGIGLGAMGGRLVRFARLRSVMLGCVAGLLGGIVAMSTMHYARYLEFRSDVDRVIAKMSPEAKKAFEMPEERLRAKMASAGEPPEKQREVLGLWRHIHTDSFAAFMQLRANQGVEIRRHRSARINLGFVGSWIYWVVEVAMAAGVTTLFVRGATREPYCTGCDAWKHKQAFRVAFAGRPLEAKAALESGATARFLRNGISPIKATHSSLMLTMAVCPHCQQGTMDVLLQAISRDKKGKISYTELAHVTYPAEAKADLQACFAAPVPNAVRNA